MKKKLFLMLALVAIVCLFTLSVSAAPQKPDLGVSFGEVQEISGFTPPSQRFVNTNERVLLYDGSEYVTYPTYYIMADVTTFNDNNSFDFSKLEEATQKDFNYNSIILLEISEGITGLAGWAVYECKNCIYVNVPSTVATYSADVFAETPWLQAIEFESGNTSVTMGARMFYKSSGLKYIRLPNNLVTMGSDAFRFCTSLETLVLGANFENLAANGYNFAGPEPTLTTEIYISTAFGSNGLNTNMFNWNSTATKDENAKMIFHFAGTREEAEELQAKSLQTSNNGKISYAIIVSKDEFVKAERDTTKNYIVYGYNLCDMFYGGAHSTSQINPCVVECSICEDRIVNHISDYESLAIEYANGFMAKGKKTGACTNEGCTFKCNEELNPLFTCLGYSAPENGNDGIAVGFTVDIEAIKEYEKVTDKTLKYGAFAVAKQKIGDNYIFASDGTVASNAIVAELSNYEFVSFELKIVGFTDEYKDAKLAMGAYAIVSDENATEYSYIQAGAPLNGEKYSFVSYYDIAGKPSNEEELPQ